jgi:hypothetical protein
MSRLGRIVAAFSGCAVLLAVLAGCAAPAYTYAADKTDGAYFKVPSSWNPIPDVGLADIDQTVLANSLAGPQGGQLTWAHGYVGSSTLDLSKVLLGSSVPIVYASVQDVSTTVRSALSYNIMKDLIYPVTTSVRQAAQQSGATWASTFQPIRSTLITQHDGVHGIIEEFTYQINGRTDVVLESVLTNTPTTKLYQLFVQCYASCFLKHRTQIVAILQSFTVG